MPDIDSYVGQPYLANPHDKLLNLDEGIQLNLDSICELVLPIFDAHFCRLFCCYDKTMFLVSQKGEMNQVTQQLIISKKELVALAQSSNSLNTLARITTPNDESLLRHISPIILPSGLVFGYLEFYRDKGASLNSKEQAIITVLQRDIGNHLLQHKHLLAAAKSRELHLLISKHNRDWIFVKDTDFRIVYANEAFLNAYPQAASSISEQDPSSSMYQSITTAASLEQDKIALSQGQSVTTEDMTAADGSIMVYETVKRRFEDGDGVPYILCIRRDITERERFIRQLKEANNDLDDFTKIASHDLKAPLNAIRRLLSWIEEDCQHILPEESVENLRLVISRANRMQSLLEDLLTFAKIGREDKTVTCIELAKLISDLNPLLDLPAGFEINVEPAELVVPSVPFKTVMLNLVGNAIKHNDKDLGKVEVGCKINKFCYEISISDNGPGIEEKYFERIFQLFQTLKSRDELEASGIGLAVVKKYVNQFGGRIEIDSDGVNGTTFTVFWPKPK
ncbi:Phytochrome-like protein cph1 [Paraglaciecola mesophila]|uniref:histidine kinase n=1 Tax=Paraglaciecola mesophila TaxID=197222 RepID=A0A857JMK5_9ALTE|nr:ATP-binding protein [Paraglaciecola mesophila]QHJ13123.1 Phytochrome-like protein cph1 [Paraglaciecola mesophila]